MMLLLMHETRERCLMSRLLRQRRKQKQERCERRAIDAGLNPIDRSKMHHCETVRVEVWMMGFVFERQQTCIIIFTCVEMEEAKHTGTEASSCVTRIHSGCSALAPVTKEQAPSVEKRADGADGADVTIDTAT